jgi:polysaccharide export outer membrane protein
MRKITLLSTLCVSILMLASCGTVKDIAYFQNKTKNHPEAIDNEAGIVIQPKDMISIVVSSRNPELVTMFNLPVVSYQAGSEIVSGAGQQRLLGYVVDEEGNIDFPVLGKLHIVGMSQSEVINLIEGKLQGQLVNPIVTMRFLNARVTVLGEVRNPGTYVLNNGRMTLLEALGIAGDLTQYARRENILVTRENNGKVEFARLNLSSDEIFTSPYFYLQQNDVVYVEPNQARTTSNQSISLWLSMVGTVSSASTVVVSVLSATGYFD